MTHALRLGLTGGIGSGKSTVARLLAELGAGIIDADATARALTAPGGAAIEPIRQAFGTDFITADGALDRDHMRTLVFADSTAKQRLEAIVHPLVGQQTQAQALALADAGHRCLVFDVPLLVESGHWRARLDRVLVIDCREETQIERVIARSQLARPVIEGIMAAQAQRVQRLQAADAVIYNDGLDLAQLRAQVRSLAPTFGLSSPHPSDFTESA